MDPCKLFFAVKKKTIGVIFFLSLLQPDFA